MALFRAGVFSRATFFDFNIKCLFLIGLWPNQEWPWSQRVIYRCYHYSLLLMLMAYLATTGFGMFAYKDDIIRVLDDIDKAIVAYNYTLKIILFMIKQNQVMVLIEEILHSVTITSIVGCFQMVGMSKGELVVDAWLPFETTSPSRILLAGGILAVLFTGPIMFRGISIQGIVYCTAMYVCDQLVDLQDRLKALNYSVATDKAMRQEFKDIIKKHIRLVEYSRSMKSVFKEYFLIQNLAVTVELCLSALLMSTVGMEQKKYLISFSAFLIAALINAYILCNLGQELIDQSAGVAYAAYESTWTSWPLDMQKDLLIFITAAQRDLTLSAGGIASMCMETYALALYNGYSIYAVLRDMVNH